MNRAILDWGRDCVHLWGWSPSEAKARGLAGLFQAERTVDTLFDWQTDDCPLVHLDLVCSDGDRRTASCTLRRHRIAGASLYTLLVQETREHASVTPIGREMLDAIPGLFYVIDRHARLQMWNQRLLEAFELEEKDMAGIDVMPFIDLPERAVVRNKIQEAFTIGTSSHEATLVGRNGRRAPYAFQCAATHLLGEPCVLGSAVDITERKNAELRLLLTERAMEACVDAIIITRRAGTKNFIEYVNPSFTRTTGYTYEESIGRDPSFLRAPHMDADEAGKIRDAVASNQKVQALLRNRRKNGEVFWNELQINPVLDASGKATHSVAVTRDVTQAVRFEDQLRHMATHDRLTGLANRAMLSDNLKRAIARAGRAGHIVALAYIDLDNFKLINDTLGHDGGDKMLIEIARRLQAQVRGGDTLARLGGDEFVLVWSDCRGVDQLAEMMQRLHAGVTGPMLIAGRTIEPMASIGVSVYPNDASDGASVLRAADAAMYQAKASGKNQCKMYSADMDRSIHDYMERELSLRRAIERDELILHYQPKVHLNSGRIVGAEALVRWNHHEKGMVMPDQFISLAEESGSIIELGELVLEHACRMLRTISDSGFADFTLSVNLSARQLRNTWFAATVEMLLNKYKLHGGALELEVTESQLMDSPEGAAKLLDDLKLLGVQLSIDDFGTGYSSLSYLQKFPVDYIKIDRSFLADLKRSGQSIIAQAIIGLAHKLDIAVVAEGVETEAQLAFLRKHECDLMQGHHFSAAVPGNALLAMIRADVRMH